MQHLVKRVGRVFLTVVVSGSALVLSGGAATPALAASGPSISVTTDVLSLQVDGFGFTPGDQVQIDVYRSAWVLLEGTPPTPLLSGTTTATPFTCAGWLCFGGAIHWQTQVPASGCGIPLVVIVHDTTARVDITAASTLKASTVVLCPFPSGIGLLPIRRGR